ncbi:FAD-dependent monooxygenase [Nocardia sp. alder85J]|uniref:FAD-dependent monooxygenase n=1 Tax=Nocardia sp. alder85J TaxID=2862949 RepID=UPI001CD7DCB7|nr:FAD-dependent monooxygenase [Nocardia sp. alder85J]MCX4092912.1 FAD-dependent monooxygenase [Nocardia sp. alder85J]
MPENSCDVVISGAGPNGLMLACELALAGARPIVLEQSPGPSADQKANGLVGQVVRAMDMRGLYPTAPPHPVPFYPFAAMTLNFTGLHDNPMYAWPIPQPALTRMLAERAAALGVEVRWRHTVTGFTQDPAQVTVTAAGPAGDDRLTAAYLVAADGGKSSIRKRSGIGFPGFTAADRISRIGNAVVPTGLRTLDGGLDIPGAGRFRFGHNRVERGVFVFAELQPGRAIVSTVEYDADPVDEHAPMTFAELRDSVTRLLGAELPMQPLPADQNPVLRRNVGQNTRTADRYRDRRVLLLGDAAHVHSAMGGPGLNLGLQDAINLGWKLAAEVRGHAPAGLLDTYDSERRPVAERVMMQTLAQSGLVTPGPETTAVRQLFGELLELPGVTEHIARLMAGSDTPYDTGCAHPLAGRLAPDLTVATPDGPRRLADLLHPARPLLLDPTGGTPAAAWSDRVDTVPAPDAPATLLIRPDGYIAWAADEPDPDGLHTALTRWFGPARHLTTA